MLSFLVKLIEQVTGVRALRRGYNDHGLSAVKAVLLDDEDSEIYIFAPIPATDDLDDKI